MSVGQVWNDACRSSVLPMKVLLIHEQLGELRIW